MDLNITQEFSNLNENEKLELIISILVPIFFGLIAIIGFFGNILVIVVVIANSQIQPTTNLLIVNLACADLLFVIFCIPFTACDYIFRKWPFSLAWCKIVQYLIVVTVCASIYTLVLMSLDRFLAVLYPISSRTIRTERITKISICCMWLIFAVVAIPTIFSHGLENYETELNYEIQACTFIGTSYLSWNTYHIIFILITYLIPLFLISGMYFRIVKRLRRNVTSSRSKQGRKRVTKLVAVVVLAFALLWSPIQIILVLKSFGIFHTNSTITILFQIIAHTLAYTSSCINPLLYAFLSEHFRKAFQKIVNYKSKYKTISNNQEIRNAEPTERRTSAYTSTF